MFIELIKTEGKYYKKKPVCKCFTLFSFVFRAAAAERIQYVINEVRISNIHVLQSNFNIFSQKNKRSAEKVAIDGTFIKRIAAILRIIIPGVFSPEAGFMILVAAALVARSSCDIWMIQNSTSIERLLFCNILFTSNYLMQFLVMQCYYWAQFSTFQKLCNPVHCSNANGMKCKFVSSNIAILIYFVFCFV